MCEECCGKQTAHPSEEEEPENLREQMILAEYNSCRDMIMKNIEIMERSMLLAVTAVAAIAAFCLNTIIAVPLTASQYNAIKLLSSMPVIIAILGFLRFKSIDKAVGIYNDYLAFEVEERFKGLRFTRYFRRKNKRFSIRIWHWLFWGALVFFTAIFLVFVYRYKQIVPPHTVLKLI